MLHNYTIIWRSGNDPDFRVDHVVILNNPDVPITQEMILRFAGQEYIGETTGNFPLDIHQPEVTELFYTIPYDLIAIFEGHCKDVRTD